VLSTSEAAATAAFQAAPQWSTRLEPAPANDLFGALVNHSAAADIATPSPPLPPQRRSAETLPPADNAAAPNGASYQPAGNDPNSNANAGPSPDNYVNNANSNGPTTPAAAQSSQAKSTTASKADSTKSTDKSANGDASAADLTILVQQAGLTATTPIPVAVAIPVTTTATNVPAVPPASGSSTAPLAIAAAAIAASSQAGAAQAAASVQAKTDSSPIPTTTTAPATVPGTATSSAAATATAKIVIPAAASAAVTAPVIESATRANAEPTSLATLASAVAATAPVTPKPSPGKTPAATAPTDGSTTTNTTDPSATNAPAGVQNGLPLQSSAAAKPQAANAAVEAASADAATATSAAAVSAREHSPAAGAGHALPDSPDAGTQPVGTFQPQLNTPAAAAAPATAFNVTAATNGPVPVSGLALEIAASVKSGKSRFEIRLDPADLGRIDVRIDIDRNGQVTSHLTVEKPETLSMLRQDAPQLQRALDDAGLKTGSGGLQFSLRDQSSSGQNSGNDTSANAQRLVISEENTIPAAVAGRSYGRPLGPSSGVDIRV
jgi:flagellar hook-length control protein FliK